MAKRLRQVALFIPPSPGYFSDVVMGIQEFTRGKGAWATEIYATLPGATAATHHWRPDGAIVNCTDGDWAPLLTRLRIPTVQIGGDSIPHLRAVRTDNQAIGRLAAEHFLDRGFSNFAFCGYNDAEWSLLRQSAYVDELTRAGRSCLIFPGKAATLHTSQIAHELSRWLRSLPQPVAVFACHDRVAMLLGHACRYADLMVPDTVAILGVDNNPLECYFTSPPISSVMGSARRIGYQAAALLDRMMRGEKPPKTETVVAPAGVAERTSTDLFAAEDKDLVTALRYIREHADESIHVDDVARAAIVTRRMLERKFRFILGRSPREQILKAHVEQAKKLLIESNLSMLEIAMRSGFPSASKFSAVFKRETTHPPAAFRRLYGATQNPGNSHG